MDEIVRDRRESARLIVTLPGGVSPDPPATAPVGVPRPRVLDRDDGDDTVAIPGEMAARRSSQIPPSVVKLHWLEGPDAQSTRGPLTSPSRPRPKKIIVRATPNEVGEPSASPESSAVATRSPIPRESPSPSPMSDSGRHSAIDDSGGGIASEQACIQTLGALLFNYDQGAGLQFWAQHGLCSFTDPVSVAALLISTDGLSFQRITEYITEPTTSALLCRAFADLLVGSPPCPIIDALRRYFSKLQMPSDGARWRRLAVSFAESFSEANPSAVATAEQCERVITAILAVNEGLHSDDGASQRGRPRPMESRAGFTLELRGSMRPELLAATYDSIAADALIPGQDHTEDCRTALAMLTRVGPTDYEDPARFYVAYHEVVLVEDPRKITPSGKRKRCLMIFNDVIFFCKPRPTGYEVRAVMPTAAVYAKVPSLDLYPTAVVLADAVTHETQLTLSTKPDELNTVIDTINRLHTQQQFVVHPCADTLDELVGSLADDSGNGILVLGIHRLGTLSDEVIEAEVLRLNGVLSAAADLVTALVMIKYNPEQIGPCRIHRFVNALGVRTVRMPSDVLPLPTVRGATDAAGSLQTVAEDDGDDSDDFEDVAPRKPPAAKHSEMRESGGSGGGGDSDDSDEFVDRKVDEADDSDEFNDVASPEEAFSALDSGSLGVDDKIQNLESELKRLLLEKDASWRRRAYNTLREISERNAVTRGAQLRVNPQTIPKYHLHDVVNRGDVGATSTLLAMALCNPGEVDEEGRTPLMHAAAGNSDGCAQVLLTNGVDPNVTGLNGAAALHEAALRGDRAVMRTLVAGGARLDVADAGGRLPIHWAVSDPAYTGALSYILDTTAAQYVNVPANDGMTPVMIAAFHNRADCVQMLLEHRADLDEKDKDGKTAAHWSVHPDDNAAFDVLFNLPTTFYKDFSGMTLAHRVGETGSAACADQLLAIRPDCMRDIDKASRTPLIWSAAYNNPTVLRIFLQSPETDAHHRASSGKTALDYAVSMQHTECERILREFLAP